jgi:hypothetical protein
MAVAREMACESQQICWLDSKGILSGEHMLMLSLRYCGARQSKANEHACGGARGSVSWCHATSRDQRRAQFRVPHEQCDLLICVDTPEYSVRSTIDGRAEYCVSRQGSLPGPLPAPLRPIFQ